MNVRKLKRMSKRSVSMLLSLLMVLTVCMVGTVTTVSADNYEGRAYVTFEGKAWSSVYLYIGHSTYSRRYDFTKIEGKNLWKSNEENIGYGDAHTCFFSNIATTAQNNKSISDCYNDCSSGYRTTSEVRTFTNPLITITTDSNNNVTITIKNNYSYLDPDEYAMVDCTLYNYRNDYQIYKNNNTASANVAVQRDKDGGQSVTYVSYTQSWNGYIDNFNLYNTAVSGWYSSQNSKRTDKSKELLPLYQGNFRGMNDNDGVSGTANFIKPGNNKRNYYHFVSLANGANRQYGSKYEHASTRSVAWGLVDDTLKDTDNDGVGDTLTQNGIEIPQFSDSFMSSSTYGKASISGSSKNAVQTKIDDLKFPFNKKEKTGTHNTLYYYDASTENNNRYYQEGNSTLQIGTSVYGRDAGGNKSDKRGYYPFNSTNPSDAKDLVNCFGTRFDIEFIMPSSRKIGGTNGTTEEDLVFSFAGDDDVWVYIDGVLALDLGGQHNKGEGSINLTECKAYYKTGYYSVSYTNYNGADSSNPNLSSSTTTNPSGTWYNGSRQQDNNSGFTTETVTFSSTSELYEILHQTNQKHTLTVFYMERGEFDSNFYMDFLLPIIDSENDNELTITQKVNADNVNEGLRLETMNIANKDIFATKVQTQHMKAASDNPITLPATVDFKRRQDMYVGTNNDNMTLIQKIQASYTNPTYRPDKNVESQDTEKNIYSAYSWIDRSVLLGEDGKVTKPTQKAYRNSGVGLPYIKLNAEGTGFDSSAVSIVPLLYDQSAIFFNQFSTESSQSGKEALVSVVLNSSIARFSGDSRDNTGTKSIADVSVENRLLDDYYTPSLNVKGCNATAGQATAVEYNGNSSGKFYLKENKASFNFVETVKTGNIVIKKEVEGNDKTENDKKTEYTFEIRYKNLFGDATAEDRLDTDTWKTAALIGTRSGKDAEGKDYTSANNSLVTSSDGRFGMVAGSTVTFSGIPVGTIIQIKEYSENHPITDIPSSVGKVRFTGMVAEGTESIGAGTETSNLQNYTNKEDLTTSKETATLDGVSKTLTTVNTDAWRLTNREVNSTVYDTWTFEFTNSYAHTPILYRYIDRKLENGKPTSLMSNYTYFTKGTNLKYSEMLDGTTIKDDAQTAIAELSPQIINVICVYNLTKGGKYWTGQAKAYSDRNDFATVKGTQTSQFNLEEITTELNAVLNAMYTDGTADIKEANYAGLDEACGNTADNTGVVGLKATLRSIIDGAISDYKTAHSNSNAAPTKAQLIAMFQEDNNNYFLYSDSKYYIVQATYENTLRRYDVEVETYAPTGGITVNGSGKAEGSLLTLKYSVPYNGLSSLVKGSEAAQSYGSAVGTVDKYYTSDMLFVGDTQATLQALKLDESANKLFRIRINETTDEYIYFAYWERQVRYNTGNQIETKWIPVSTNYDYHYRVNDHVKIRAVYQKEDGTRYDPTGANTTFVPIDSNENVLIGTLYPTPTKTTRYIYWKTINGVKKYASCDDLDDDDSYTIPASFLPSPLTEACYATTNNVYGLYVHSETDRLVTTSDLAISGFDSNGNALHSIEVMREGEDGTTIKVTKKDTELYNVGYCVPNKPSTATNGEGYGTSATDRTMNSYTKEVSTTTNNVTTTEKQDRTRVDIIFGSPTGEDYDIKSDTNADGIEQVGYILFQSPKYADRADAVYGDAQEFRNALLSNGNKARELLESTSSSATNMRVTQSVKQDDSSAECYSSTDGKKYGLQCTMGPVYPDTQASGSGIKLTNKNRYNIVFDMINTESSRQYYYTVYLVTKRNGTYYISPSPATFTLADADPAVKDTEGKRAYLMRIKHQWRYEDGTDYTDGNPHVGSLLSNYTTAVDGREIAYTNRTTNWIDPDTGIPYTGELESLTIGNNTKDISGIKKRGTITDTFVVPTNTDPLTPANSTISDPNASYFDVIAKYVKKVLGIRFDVKRWKNTTVTTSVLNDSDGAVIGFNKAYTEALTDESKTYTTPDGQVVPYDDKLKVVVKAADGYTIDTSTIPTKLTIDGIPTPIEDGITAVLSEDNTTWTATVNDTLLDDESNKDWFAQLLLNLPKAKELTYTFTVKSNPADVFNTNVSSTKKAVTVTTSVEDMLGTIGSYDSTSKTVTVTVSKSQLDDNGGSIDYTLTAINTDDYTYDDWKKNGTHVDTNNTGTYTYSFTADDNGAELVANYHGNSTTISFTMCPNDLAAAYWSAANADHTNTIGVATALNNENATPGTLQWKVKYSIGSTNYSIDVPSSGVTYEIIEGKKYVTYTVTIPAGGNYVVFYCDAKADYDAYDVTGYAGGTIETRYTGRDDGKVDISENRYLYYDGDGLYDNTSQNPPQKFKIKAKASANAT